MCILAGSQMRISGDWLPLAVRSVRHASLIVQAARFGTGVRAYGAIWDPRCPRSRPVHDGPPCRFVATRGNARGIVHEARFGTARSCTGRVSGQAVSRIAPRARRIPAPVSSELGKREGLRACGAFRDGPFVHGTRFGTCDAPNCAPCTIGGRVVLAGPWTVVSQYLGTGMGLWSRFHKAKKPLDRIFGSANIVNALLRGISSAGRAHGWQP